MVSLASVVIPTWQEGGAATSVVFIKASLAPHVHLPRIPGQAVLIK